MESQKNMYHSNVPDLKAWCISRHKNNISYIDSIIWLPSSILNRLFSDSQMPFDFSLAVIVNNDLGQMLSLGIC